MLWHDSSDSELNVNAFDDKKKDIYLRYLCCNITTDLIMMMRISIAWNWANLASHRNISHFGKYIWHKIPSQVNEFFHHTFILVHNFIRTPSFIYTWFPFDSNLSSFLHISLKLLLWGDVFRLCSIHIFFSVFTNCTVHMCVLKNHSFRNEWEKNSFSNFNSSKFGDEKLATRRKMKWSHIFMHVLTSIKQNKRYVYFDYHLCCTERNKCMCVCVFSVTPRQV